MTFYILFTSLLPLDALANSITNSNASFPGSSIKFFHSSQRFSTITTSIHRKSLHFFAHTKKCGDEEEREAWINYTLLTFDLIIICAGFIDDISLQNSDSVQQINNIFLGSFFHVNLIEIIFPHTQFSPSSPLTRLVLRGSLQNTILIDFCCFYQHFDHLSESNIFSIIKYLHPIIGFSLHLFKRIFLFDDWLKLLKSSKFNFYGEILDEISTTIEVFYFFLFFCNVHILTKQKKISHKPFQLLRVSLVNWFSRRLARVKIFSDFPFLRVVQVFIQRSPNRAGNFPLEIRNENINVVCGNEKKLPRARIICVFFCMEIGLKVVWLFSFSFRAFPSMFFVEKFKITQKCVLWENPTQQWEQKLNANTQNVRGLDGKCEKHSEAALDFHKTGSFCSFS